MDSMFICGMLMGIGLTMLVVLLANRFQRMGSQFVTFRFSPEVRARFGRLVYKAKNQNHHGLMRSSLFVFDAVVKTHEEGGKILLEDADGHQQAMNLSHVLA